MIYKRVLYSRPRLCDEVNQNVCERFTSLSLNCYGSDCNIDNSLCVCSFSGARCECLSLLSCLSLSGEKCCAPLRSLGEQFAPHSTHVHDSNLNLSVCIRMLVSVLTYALLSWRRREICFALFLPCSCRVFESLLIMMGGVVVQRVIVSHTHTPSLHM